LEEFHRLADEFVSPELNDSSFARSFKETSFVDRSNGNATFFYHSQDPSSEIKRVDVVTRKGDVYDEVKSIYIEKSNWRADTSLIKKLHWKPKRNFQLITVMSAGNRKSKNELIKVVWDNRE
jgi:hypothetical protein